MNSRSALCLLLFFCLGASAQSGQAGPVLTIYNSNVALVCERRSVQLAAGVQELAYADVPAMIDPTSVHVTSLTSPQDMALLEQRFEYDLIGVDRLLEQHLNRDIIVSITQGRTLSGRLLSSQGSDTVLREQDGTLHVIKSASIQSIQFPALPAGLVTKPTLVWTLDCKKPGVHDIETSYLTTGMSWHVEYAATLNSQETQMDLQGWASIENRSGASYQNASLRLVAGDVNREPQVQFMKKASISEMARAPVPPEQFEEKQFFEYHLYSLQRPATLKDMETRQISMLAAPSINIEKLYTYDGQRHGKDVRVSLQCRNAKAGGLGLPLPAGKVRIYKKDGDSSRALIGEELIGHTPVDELLKFQTGSSFDIVGERTVKEVKQVSQNSRRETIEIRLRNRKQDDITVVVVERFAGSWELQGETPPIKNRSARTIEFEMAIPRSAEKAMVYTVLYTY